MCVLHTVAITASETSFPLRSHPATAKFVKLHGFFATVNESRQADRVNRATHQRAPTLSTSVMLSAVIFDLDGVLADSEPWWNEIDAKLLAEYGVTYRGEYHQNVVGVNYRLAVEFYKKAFGLSRPLRK